MEIILTPINYSETQTADTHLEQLVQYGSGSALDLESANAEFRTQSMRGWLESILHIPHINRA